MLLPADDEAPVRKAEAQFDAPVQLASLNLVPVAYNNLTCSPNYETSPTLNAEYSLKALCSVLSITQRLNGSHERDISRSGLQDCNI